MKLSNIQKESIKKAYGEAKTRAYFQGDQNTTIQGIGQLEGIRFMLEVMGVTLEEVGILKDKK